MPRPLGADSAIQQQQLGTGHAAASAREALADFDGTLLIVNGDMPLITADTIAECLKAQARTGLALLAFEAADPGAYGRVLLTPDGFLDRIVEFKDASAVGTRHHPVQCRLLCRRRAEVLPLGGGAEERQCPEGILPDRRARAGARRRREMRRRA